MRSFGETLCTGKINIDEAETDQINLLENWYNLVKDLDQKQ